MVIGNNAYHADGASLVAAVPDAKAVAAALPGLGFEPKNIVTAYDADLSGLKAAVRRFIEDLGSGDTAVVYYAGHGVEVRGRNYLLPVDFKPDASELEVMDSAYGLLLEDLTFVPGRTPEPITNREPQPGDVRTRKDGLRYVYVPPGTFRQGCSTGDSECDGGEKPAHDVQITRGFWMGQTEVTVEAYRRFVTATGRQMPGEPAWKGGEMNAGWANGSMPMVKVGWNEAKSYCGWAGLRLPTEAEWEYAARGGISERNYGQALSDVAWFADNSGKEALNAGKLDDYFGRLALNENAFHPVGLKAPNRFGLYDMLGNVWEWVNDWYSENYYSGPDSRDPQGPPNGMSRVVRGGSFFDYAAIVRVSTRWPKSGTGHSIGFRCAGD
ncbi:MAG: SUMF1/EgtB/PvdO family nonheme iron enzyme [Bdellovibrionales bacterium]|nr:SUMF1/EgtB/PvdO family nonheme iron enzyme [Bdellovibrionales bacterium]